MAPTGLNRPAVQQIMAAESGLPKTPPFVLCSEHGESSFEV